AATGDIGTVSAIASEAPAATRAGPRDVAASASHGATRRDVDVRQRDVRLARDENRATQAGARTAAVTPGSAVAADRNRVRDGEVTDRNSHRDGRATHERRDHQAPELVVPRE